MMKMMVRVVLMYKIGWARRKDYQIMYSEGTWEPGPGNIRYLLTASRTNSLYNNESILFL